MPRQPADPDRDPMAGEVDRLLRQLGPEISDPTPSRPPTQPPARSPARSSPLPAPDAPAPLLTFVIPTALGVWGRVVLAAALVGGLTQWPYQHCGLALGAYLAAAAVALVAGVWAAVASWRTEMGRAHVVAITLIFTAAALGALQVLPRLGYGSVETAWRCLR